MHNHAQRGTSDDAFAGHISIASFMLHNTQKWLHCHSLTDQTPIIWTTVYLKQLSDTLQTGTGLLKMSNAFPKDVPIKIALLNNLVLSLREPTMYD